MRAAKQGGYSKPSRSSFQRSQYPSCVVPSRVPTMQPPFTQASRPCRPVRTLLQFLAASPLHHRNPTGRSRPSEPSEPGEHRLAFVVANAGPAPPHARGKPGGAPQPWKGGYRTEGRWLCRRAGTMSAAKSGRSVMLAVSHGHRKAR